MNITIEWGWWLLPFAITVGTFIAALTVNKQAGDGGGWFAGVNALFSFLNYLILCVVPSLVAWLVWSIFR